MARAEEIKKVQRLVLRYARLHGRASLPWRKTRSPYKILVSEIMLQQTQVNRVVPFYANFLKQFPDPHSLAQAPLKDVLKAWSGLGYNRRARFLQEAMREVVKKRMGKLPKELADLKALPGVGDYTAKAIRVFAHNEKEVLIETNVRSVVLHHFFSTKSMISDVEIQLVAAKLAERQDPRIWHAALMDYGTHLKTTMPNPSRRSKHHKKQKPFKGSLREVRGAIIRVLNQHNASKMRLKKELPTAMHERIQPALLALTKEKIVASTRGVFSVCQ